MDYDKLIELALLIGSSLSENGAETYRVEESIFRILSAYHVEKSEVFAIPSCIIVTIKAKDENEVEKSFTRMKRITEHATNLQKISMLNDLCRRICRDTPNCETAKGEIEILCSVRKYPFVVSVAACSIISFAFTLFFKGGFYDALCAAFCGVVLQLAMTGMLKQKANWFFANIVGSAIVAIIAYGAVALGICSHFDKIIIGTLMNLVPGVALTNSMRDIIAGDLLAGLIRLTEALMVALAIAIGTGIALYTIKLL